MGYHTAFYSRIRLLFVNRAIRTLCYGHAYCAANNLNWIYLYLHITSIMLTVLSRVSVVIPCSRINLRIQTLGARVPDFITTVIPFRNVYKTALLARPALIPTVRARIKEKTKREVKGRKQGRNSFALKFTFRYHNGHHCFSFLLF